MLMNYVSLETGVPCRMHFTDDYNVERTIADTERKGSKRVTTLVFWVDELNGERVARTFSVISSKLASKLGGYLKDKQYTNYDFVITKRGEAYLTEYTVEALPR